PAGGRDGHRLHRRAQPGPVGVARDQAGRAAGTGVRRAGGAPRHRAGAAQGRRPLDRGTRLAKGARLRHARPHKERSGRPSEGAAAGVSVVVVGLNQRTVALEMLERMTVSDAQLHKALRDLKDRSHLSEVVVLSTCMRTEVYAVVERFHGGVSDIRGFLAGLSSTPPEDFADDLYSYFEEGAAAHLFEMAAALAASAGARRVMVANRTQHRAVELAERVGGETVELGALSEALAGVDVVLTSTGSPSILLEASDLAPVVHRRRGRPLLVMDVAVPRDVDPGVAELDGVTLLDMDDLRSFAEAGMAGRRREVARVRTLVDQEVDRYLDSTAARGVAPLVAALRAHAE